MIKGFGNIDLWRKKAPDYVLEKPKLMRFRKSISKYNKICEKSAEKKGSILYLANEHLWTDSEKIDLLDKKAPYYFLEKPKDQKG